LDGDRWGWGWEAPFIPRQNHFEHKALHGKGFSTGFPPHHKTKKTARQTPKRQDLSKSFPKARQQTHVVKMLAYASDIHSQSCPPHLPQRVAKTYETTLKQNQKRFAKKSVVGGAGQGAKGKAEQLQGLWKSNIVCIVFNSANDCPLHDANIDDKMSSMHLKKSFHRDATMNSNQNGFCLLSMTRTWLKLHPIKD